MESLRDQIANKCIYFNGLINKKCEIGITYNKVKIHSKPIKIPCIKDTELNGGYCKKAEFPSEEKIDKEVRELEQLGQRSVKAIKAVKDHIKKTNKIKDKIKCPLCGGNLYYTMAVENKHTRGICDKCKINWME